MKAIIDADYLIYSSAIDKNSLQEALDDFNEKLEKVLVDLGEYCVVSDVVLCNGGSNSYRLSLNKEYKANRKGDKPVFLNALHKEVQLSYNSYYSDKHETDDVVATLWQQEVDNNGEDTVIIVANDKDYKQFPCWYFDMYWSRRNLEKIELLGSLKNFYGQMIIGDTADNVNYIKGKGKSFVNKLFKGISTEYALFRRVYLIFIEEYGGDAKDKFTECYKILKLRTDIYGEIKSR